MLSGLDLVFERLKPDFLIVENPLDARRGKRAVELVFAAHEVARSRGMRTAYIAAKKRKEYFAGMTKHEIATGIAEMFPELKQHLPPKRKLWQSEAKRMNIFDAVALVLAACSWEAT